MEKIISFGKKYGIVGLSLLLPAMASAQLGAPPDGTQAPTNALTVGSINTTLCNAINWMFYFLIVLAVIFVMIAAFRYLTASGDPEKVKVASHTILYAAIAIAVALLAKGIPSLVGSVTGFTSGANASFCS